MVSNQAKGRTQGLLSILGGKMNLTRPFVFAALGLNLLLVASSGQTWARKSNSPEVACSNFADDSEIYGVAIHETLMKGDHTDDQILLLDQTSAGYPPGMGAWTSFGGEKRKELLDAAASKTKSDFEARTKLHCDVPKNIEPHSKIVFVTSKEEDELFSGGRDDWGAFKKKYPRASGFAIVSAIGFNATHDQALVYLGTSCGGLCGSGYLVLLTMKDGKWQVEKVANLWVS
jgi:hypothetical protein